MYVAKYMMISICLYIDIVTVIEIGNEESIHIIPDVITSLGDSHTFKTPSL